MQDLEERSGAELESAAEQVRVCEGVLEGERRQRLAVQEDLTRMTQEMQLLREDLDKERNSHRENVQVRGQGGGLHWTNVYWKRKKKRKEPFFFFKMSILVFVFIDYKEC